MILLALSAGCETDTPCGQQITARVYDRGRACLSDYAFVGCRHQEGSCPPASTYAVDGQNHCYWFRDLCLPAGFTRVPDGDTRCPPYAPFPPDCPP
jgi:hypothetical protein